MWNSRWGGGLHSSSFEKIISIENLLYAWKEFKRGKSRKKDVQEFEFNLEENFFKLNSKLTNKSYLPSKYESFFVCDPKLRHIHKAPVIDRVLHQAVFRILYHHFDRHFIHHSYSCRFNRGTHRGVVALESFCRKSTKNFTQIGWVLKLDVDKFFSNIDHDILLTVIKKYINDQRTLLLIEKIIKSFESEKGKGLPLGNVTSQLFANIYMNELDQFVKHKLKARYYLRYCDDFILINKNKETLFEWLKSIEDLLQTKLKISLHPEKTVISKISTGIDFLGYVVLPHYRVFRTKTKKRMFKKIKAKKQLIEKGEISQDQFDSVLNSYLGALSHCSSYKIAKEVKRLTCKRKPI